MCTRAGEEKCKGCTKEKHCGLPCFPLEFAFVSPGAVFGAVVGRERDGCGLARMTGSIGGPWAHLGGQDS